MGVGGQFPIANPTVGGGTAFNDIVAQLLATLSQAQGQRAGVGADIFSTLLQAETAARRRPASMVDQFFLANEFGSLMPLSQIDPGRLQQLGARTNPALGSLFESLRGFAQGAIPQGQVSNLFRDPQGNPTQAVVRLPNGQLEIIDIPEGQGVQTLQGRTGPFGLNLDDIGRLDQQLRAQMQQALRTQPGNQQAVTDFIARQSQLEQERLRQEALGQRAEGAGSAREPVQFQRGGSLVADPRRATTTGGGTTGIRAAAPVRMVDANQQTIGIAGEGARPERLAIDPLPVGLGGDRRASAQPPPPERPPGLPIWFPTPPAGPGLPPGPRPPAPAPTAPQAPDTGPAPPWWPTGPGGGFSPGTLAAMPRDVRFRLEEVMRQFPQMNVKQAMDFAQNPGSFDQFLGGAFDPRTPAARAIAGAMQSDVRFGDPFVRELALGRAPTSAQVSMAELQALQRSNPDFFNELIGVIGPDQFQQFMNVVGLGTPTGVSGARQRAVGGVRV